MQSVGNLIPYFPKDSELLINWGGRRVLEAFMQLFPTTGKNRARFFRIVTDSEDIFELLAGKLVN